MKFKVLSLNGLKRKEDRGSVFKDRKPSPKRITN